MAAAVSLVDNAMGGIAAALEGDRHDDLRARFDGWLSDVRALAQLGESSLRINGYTCSCDPQTR